MREGRGRQISGFQDSQGYTETLCVCGRGALTEFSCGVNVTVLSILFSVIIAITCLQYILVLISEQAFLTLKGIFNNLTFTAVVY